MVAKSLRRRKRIGASRQTAEESERRRTDGELTEDTVKVSPYVALTGLRPPTGKVIIRITLDWGKKLDEVETAKPETDLTKTPDGTALRQRDFVEKLLPKRAWLNDSIVNGSILYVADLKDEKCRALSSYFWPRLKDKGPTNCSRLMKSANISKENFLDIETILIPICENDHWILAVVRPQRRTASHIDSMKAYNSDDSKVAEDNSDVCRRLVGWVAATLEEKYVAKDWKTLPYKAPRQKNGWDCGVFTIVNALCLVLGVDMSLA